MIGKAIGAGLLGVILMSCAVESVESVESVEGVERGSDRGDEAPAVAARQQGLEGGLYLWACDGSNAWTRTWKVGGVEQGREICECDGTVWSQGTIGGSYSQLIDHSCSGGGGGGGGDPCLASGDPAKPFYPPPICD